VSKVYNQQCVYTLTDAQAMHDKMRTMIRIIQRAELDAGVGNAKYATYVIQGCKGFLALLAPIAGPGDDWLHARGSDINLLI
jgi:hypothetical protein